MKLLENMTEPELRDVMNTLATKVAQYVCNCRREDMVLALREAADRIGSGDAVSR